MIYLDSAATSLLRPDTVAEAVCKAIRELGSVSRGSYPAALEAARLVYHTRQLVAELFHAAGPECVAFTANATEALNIVLQGLFSAGDVVLTTVLEHNSVLRPLYRLESQGIHSILQDADAQGNVDYEQLAQILHSNPRIAAVVTTHASNLTGNRVDLARIGALCAKEQRLFIVDVSQTAGSMMIDMQQQHIDVLCFTGHKGLLGPQGTGGICVRPGLQIRSFKAGGSGIQTFSRVQPEQMPEHLEAGTMNVHGLAGLRAGLLYLRETGLEAIRQQELALMRRFYELVRDVPRVNVYGDFSQAERAPIVSLNIGTVPSGTIADRLSTQYGICTRPGGHCAPLMHRHFGTEQQGMVRFSFSSFNTMAEIERAAAAVRQLAAEEAEDAI